MYKDKYTGELIGIDYSPTAIAEMTKKRDQIGAETIKFIEMDATQMKFGVNEFDIVIDKATTDGLISNPKGGEFIELISDHVGRVLKPEGIYVIISHLEPQDHNWLSNYLLPPLTADPKFKWKILVNSVEASKSEVKPPNVYLITKKLLQENEDKDEERVSVEQQYYEM
eukprot:TRINITY_DN6382_c0_g1_i2.p1 TRINITY_DN6382_c0_g1~~TRINITY_DN6382_c0_g1_i2.p1  ORF type:complete len:169 (-),score=36.14 TRINITY_DN6382_c0_g1_i2:23-529(-)